MLHHGLSHRGLLHHGRIEPRPPKPRRHVPPLAPMAEEARKLGSNLYIERSNHLQPLDLHAAIAPAAALLLRQRSPVGIAQPKPQQMPPPMRLGPVLECTPA